MASPLMSVSLPVLPASDSSDATRSSDLAGDLRQLDIGEVFFDRHHRMLYSTDASIYQVEPLGVVVPRSPDRLGPLMEYCSAHKVAVLPRGGGTSLAGQCTGRALVVDMTPTCRRIISVDVERRQCVVEPGVTIDDLNRHLQKENSGLFFAPDPATVAQAAIGGCIGNNAAGARSIRYGRTSENLGGVDVVLSSGRRLWLEAGAGRNDVEALRLSRAVTEIVAAHADEIRRRFPKLVRRNAGYGLDLVLDQLDRGVAVEDLDLAGLICGSEGTLAFIAGARLVLRPVPVARCLVLLAFESLDDAIGAVAGVLKTKPTAVELLDQVVLGAAALNSQSRKHLSVVPLIDGALPKAVLYVEYSAEQSAIELDESVATLAAAFANAPMNVLRGAAAMAPAWALRKAVEPLLHGLSATRKPQTFIEDNSVPVENLPRFVREIRKIAARHGTVAAYYAHASVGVLHIRPMIDLHDPADRERLRKIAVEVADLARDCGGVMSGEHGDGRVRGPLLERFFGANIVAAFAKIKAVFDPAGILNPGDIVGAGPIESITESLRVRPADRDVIVPEVRTYFDYSGQHDFGGALEMCNGAGVCRKLSGGTMCPSYRATLDERHSTRGRANALRLIITGQLPGDAPDARSAGAANSAPALVWDDPETLQTLDLCLGCKACKAECPSSVDVARLKSEYLAHSFEQRGGAPQAARWFGRVRTLLQMASIAPGLARWMAGSRPGRMIMNRLLNLDPRRSLPPVGPSLYRWFSRRQRRMAGTATTVARPRVVLFADCFTAYGESAIGRAAVNVLESLGYEVLLPKVGCCGRAMISNGLLSQASATIDATLEALLPIALDPSVRAVVFCEPSCQSAAVDDWLDLRLTTDHGQRRQLVDKCRAVEDFVHDQWEQHPIRPVAMQGVSGGSILFHGHCHQKALWGESASAAAVGRTGAAVRVIPSGCCGMAGAFGFTRDHYDLSMKIGELSVFGEIRSSPHATVAACGASCRHQIRDATGRTALHPIEIIEKAILSRGSSADSAGSAVNGPQSLQKSD